jgi:hypothetical protein
MNTHRIKDGQLVAVRRLVGDVVKDKPGQLYVVSQLVGRNLRTLADLTAAEWRMIRNDAYPNWKDDDWTVSAAFKAKLTGLRNDYLESMGQMRMF